jgi:RNA polymerase subunit RPABC4/transcription elongation factor Spt4
MALISCPECKKRISDTAEKCPSCGYSITAEKIVEIKQAETEKKQKAKQGCLIMFVGLIGVPILIIIVIIIVGSSSKTNSTPQEAVYSSSYDGSVRQVELWLKQHLNDPDSFKAIEWSPVAKAKDGNFVVRVKYRAKNSFGAYVISQKLFVLNGNGTVIDQTDYPG